MRGGLLVTDQDMAHVFLFEDCVIDVQHGTARVTPDVLHALVLECLNDDLGTTQFHLDDLRRLEYSLCKCANCIGKCQVHWNRPKY